MTNKVLEVSSEKEESHDTLKPYKTDFEYLNDHFQLIVYKMKVRAIERRIEDDVRVTIMYDHKLYYW